MWVMRGVPGSGKTHWIKTNLVAPQVFSADDFFTQNGVYKFDPQKLQEAHGKCLRGVVRACSVMETEDDPRDIVVDNTNISPIEMAPYIALAEAYGLKYGIIRMMPNLSDYALRDRCVHNVSFDKIRVMREYLARHQLPKFWKPELHIKEEGWG